MGKKGVSAVELRIIAELSRAGKSGRLATDVADNTGANIQYVRRLLAKLRKQGKVKTEGVPSPKGGQTYILVARSPKKK